MDRLNTVDDRTDDKFEQAVCKPDMSMTAVRQKLVELRKQAKLHEHKALSECLALAISLTSKKRLG